MKRPTSRDISRYAVAEEMLDDVMAFLDPGEDKKSVLDDLATALEYAGTDGYEIAKYLDDRKSWNITADMVESFDRASMIEYKLTSDAVKKWVSFYAIASKFKQGDAVEVEVRKTKYHGEIVSIDTKEAKYTVYIEALGHVKSGQGTVGIVLPFEQVESFIFQAQAV